MTTAKLYDVFLNHATADKPVVEALAERLSAAGLEPFLDKWLLVPGEPWQEALEKALDQSCTCAVFLGPGELGPWQNEEMRSALAERVASPDFRVIPVLLPGAPDAQGLELPRFLRRLTWVDFRGGLDDEASFDRLLCGILGLSPNTSGESARPPRVKVHLEQLRADLKTVEANLHLFGDQAVFKKAELEEELERLLATPRVHLAQAEGPLAVLSPENANRANLIEARKDYLEDLHTTHQFLNLKGFGVVGKVSFQLPLVDLYVPLQARQEVPEAGTLKREEIVHLAGREVTGDDERRLAERLQHPEPVLDLLTRKETGGLIVLGDPGSGKTTFLKMLALKLALGQGDELSLGSRLPALVPLSEYATALAGGNAGSLEAHLTAHLSNLGAKLPFGELLAEALDRGEALVLLDGLDEVKDPALRSTVVERVRRFFIAQVKKGNKFVVTSRVVGYHDTRPTATQGLVECTLVDFGDDEIEAFVERWTVVLERQAQGDTPVAARDAERERIDLLAAIRANPGVRRLAANPLLLTILALMKRQDVALPERRVQLYHRYVETLLDTWNRARSLADRPYTSDLDATVTLRLLSSVALWMHRENPGAGLVKQGELERHLEGLFAQQAEADPEAAAKRFLADVGKESSLLLERGSGEYGFIHLTFEEYLAAVGILRETEEDVPKVVRELSCMVGEAEWREVALLTVGQLGLVKQMEKKAGRVVEALAAERPGPLGEAVLDAGEAGVPKPSRQMVVAALAETMQGGAIPPKLRRQAGLLLGRLGWVPEDLDRFVRVPVGSFLSGDDRRQRMISRAYWVGKYPVTNLQYGRFVEDDGYERCEFWSREGWRWREEKKRTQPAFWGDRTWNNPIFPVVGVSWYEAEAYCNWLKERSEFRPGTPENLPQGYSLNLPSDFQWERAARGKDGREYPWGEGFEIRLANTQESDPERRIGMKTTAVATYPQGISPDGLWDTSGNVWEWISPWLVRGGSWINDYRNARCGFRRGAISPGFNYDVGFRCGVFPG